MDILIIQTRLLRVFKDIGEKYLLIESTINSITLDQKFVKCCLIIFLLIILNAFIRKYGLILFSFSQGLRSFMVFFSGCIISLEKKWMTAPSSVGLIGVFHAIGPLYFYIRHIASICSELCDPSTTRGGQFLGQLYQIYSALDCNNNFSCQQSRIFSINQNQSTTLKSILFILLQCAMQPYFQFFNNWLGLQKFVRYSSYNSSNIDIISLDLESLIQNSDNFFDPYDEFFIGKKSNHEECGMWGQQPFFVSIFFFARFKQTK